MSFRRTSLPPTQFPFWLIRRAEGLYCWRFTTQSTASHGSAWVYWPTGSVDRTLSSSAYVSCPPPRHIYILKTPYPQCLLSAVSVLALWPSAPRARFTAFVVSYGVLAGGYNALLPTTIAEVYGVQHYTSVNSAIYFIRGMGALFGAPLAGVILGSHRRGLGFQPSSVPSAVDLGVLKTKYNQVAFYDGALLMAAFFCVAYVRWSDARYRGRWQWKA